MRPIGRNHVVPPIHINDMIISFMHGHTSLFVKPTFSYFDETAERQNKLAGVKLDPSQSRSKSD